MIIREEQPYAQANANQGVMEVLVKAGANGGKMPEAAPAGLTAANRQFLTGECKIDQSDIDVIPKLDAKTQQMLLSRIAMRNCTLLNSFKAVRHYYKGRKSVCRCRPVIGSTRKYT